MIHRCRPSADASPGRRVPSLTVIAAGRFPFSVCREKFTNGIRGPAVRLHGPVRQINRTKGKRQFRVSFKPA